jgi:hypothetical protein
MSDTARFLRPDAIIEPLVDGFHAWVHTVAPVEVDNFSEVGFPGGKVIATPFLGEHADLDIRAKSTHCVRLGGRTKQVAEFMTWCADHGIKSDHLLGQHEWRW